MYEAWVDNGGNIYVYYGSTKDTLTIGSHIVISGAAGYTGNLLTKIDKTGNPDWVVNCASNTSITVVTTDVAGNIYLAGSLGASTIVGTDTLNLYSTGPYAEDIFVAKYKPSGGFAHAWNAGGDSQQTASFVNIDLCGNIWVGSSVRGAYSGAYSFPSYTVHYKGGSFNIPPPGGTDLLILYEFDTSGNYQSNAWLPSGGDDGMGINADSRGNIFITGDYMGTQMIVANDTLPLPPGFMAEDFFVAKYKYETVTCPGELALLVAPASIPPACSINIYPNPATYECTISSDVPFSKDSKAEIYDVTGRQITTSALSGNSAVFPVANFSPGIYTCRILIGDGGW